MAKLRHHALVPGAQSRPTSVGLRAISVTLLLQAVVCWGFYVPAQGATDAPDVCPAAVTTNVTGTVVYGSACPDVIEVTSPLVERVFGGEGDDVIYLNPEITEAFGQGGDDVIYGELPEPDEEPAGGVDYEAAEEGVPYEPEGAGAESAGGPSGESGPKYETGPRYESAPNALSIECSSNPCFGGPGDQELHGGPGNDTIFGQRGNDVLFGEDGNDQLFGGIGDDSAYGEKGADMVSGGMGADVLDGNNAADLVRGDGTTDTLKDTGNGVDTVSFASAVTPGFHGSIPYSGFPGDSNGEERGVYVRLDGTPACSNGGTGYQACDNGARYAGGNDAIEVSGFQNVIGSPFSDVIVGSNAANRIDGGGGADVILGQGGADELYGGAEGDYIDGGGGSDSANGQAGTNYCAADVEGRTNCNGTSARVTQRDRGHISVGLAATQLPSTLHYVELYLVGSNSARDDVSAAYSVDGSGGRHVVFSAAAGSATFNLSGEATTADCSYEASRVECALPRPLDVVLMGGMGGNDQLSIGGFPNTTSPVLLGGEGDDGLLGSGTTEDTLVDGDGSGNDALYGYAYDDALLNNEGIDNLQAGNGSDLLLSATACGGDTLQGAESGKGDESAVNDSSWAQVPATAGSVTADLETETAGSYYSGGPACSGEEVQYLRNINDLEGSFQSDALFGNANTNLIIGHKGEDGIYGRGGNDFLNAIDSATTEEPDSVGGGAGTDTCKLDKTDTPVASCEIEEFP
jgi:Ca2+-binding RTX toxin-like protein